MTAYISIDASDLGRLGRSLDDAADRVDEIFDSIGALLASSAQKRISGTQTAPDGAPWDPWSEAYRQTRHGNQRLLLGKGHLRQSIQHNVFDDGAIIGSNLIYALTHQEGRSGIPARPYLGVSEQDEADIATILHDFIEGAFDV